MIIKECDNFFLIKVFKDFDDNFDSFDIDSIRKLFYKMVKKLKLKYNLKGLFEADIYINSYYGIIVEMRLVDNLGEDIDVDITIHINNNFLIEIDSSSILDYRDVYYYKDKFYGTYLEISDNEVIYKNTDDIINNGIKVC